MNIFVDRFFHFPNRVGLTPGFFKFGLISLVGCFADLFSSGA